MLTNVVVTPDVMSACWAHALTTEKEEIMGLLVGKIVENTLVISAMKVIRRLTKQRDRVEIRDDSRLRVYAYFYYMAVGAGLNPD